MLQSVVNHHASSSGAAAGGSSSMDYARSVSTVLNGDNISGSSPGTGPDASGGTGSSVNGGSTARGEDPMLRAACNALLRAYSRTSPPQVERAYGLLLAMIRYASLHGCSG
jgi:hypothetical protein